MANFLPSGGRKRRSNTRPADGARALLSLPTPEVAAGNAAVGAGVTPVVGSVTGVEADAAGGSATVFANVARARFEAHVRGLVVAVLAYAEVPGEPNALELTHTVVRPGYADHGWGEALILQVLKWLEDRQVEPVVRCPLVQDVCDRLDALDPTEPFELSRAMRRTAGTGGFADVG